MMPFRRASLVAAGALLAFLALAGTSQAELVFLSSGRTLSVKSHRFQGDLVVLTLRGGGEITCEASLIDRIEPDEVPHPDPETVEAANGGDPSLPYSDLIAAAANRAGMDPRLVHAVIRVESAYRAQARSRKGAMGLMQLMPDTARQYSVDDPYDPGANIDAGTRHLKSLIDRLADLPLALAAYNAGEGTVQRFRGIPPYPETQNYVRQVLRLAGVPR
jgi:hypothetical protein